MKRITVFTTKQMAEKTIMALKNANLDLDFELVPQGCDSDGNLILGFSQVCEDDKVPVETAKLMERLCPENITIVSDAEVPVPDRPFKIVDIDQETMLTKIKDLYASDVPRQYKQVVLK
jgi:hypothetical protein